MGCGQTRITTLLETYHIFDLTRHSSTGRPINSWFNNTPPGTLVSHKDKEDDVTGFGIVVARLGWNATVLWSVRPKSSDEKAIWEFAKALTAKYSGQIPTSVYHHIKIVQP